MKIRELLSTEPVWVSPYVSVADAARVMEERSCAFMPILEDGKAIGVVTDRDLAMNVAGHGLNPHSTRVHQVMSQPPFTVQADAEPMDAAQVMIANNVRRLVVHDEGRFVGIVSVVDLAGLVPDQEVSKTLHALATQNHPREAHHETHPIPGQYLG